MHHALAHKHIFVNHSGVLLVASAGHNDGGAVAAVVVQRKNEKVSTLPSITVLSPRCLRQPR